VNLGVCCRGILHAGKIPPARGSEHGAFRRSNPQREAGREALQAVDGGELHLVVTPAGGKVWRLKYRVAGKEKLLSLEPYPAMALAAARKAADKARESLSPA
jgi:hypothetical protein